MTKLPSSNGLKACLLGPSEHDRKEDGDALAATLQDLGLKTERVALGGAPGDQTAALVINTKTKVTRELVGRLPKLELIVTSTSGYDHIDTEATDNRGIQVVRCPLARRDAVVDTSMSLGLSLLRRLPLLNDAARDGRWIRSDVKQHRIPTVKNLRVGILGLGVIGSRAKEVWTALGATVIGHDPAMEASDPLARVIQESDLITLHCSLSETSRGIFGAEAFASMRPGAVLVNTARGECVDLEAALAADHLGGLGLDVFASEPPEQLKRVAMAPQVLVSPHSAGYHSGLHHAVREEVVEAIQTWLTTR